MPRTFSEQTITALRRVAARCSRVPHELYARDVAQTGRFYEQHVGIQFEHNLGPDGAPWLLGRIGNETELLVFPGDPQPGNTPVVTVGLADGGIETLVGSLAASGVEIVTPVAEAPGGWSADFRDLNGQVLSFYQTMDKPKTLN